MNEDLSQEEQDMEDTAIDYIQSMTDDLVEAIKEKFPDPIEDYNTGSK